ncbi:sodium:solute symporter family protein [Paenibacillus sabinae]|uniref:Putative Na+/metabolite permease n=1 Tax=Paenibacillus sabinae T27 TaxID=1268072 RepID=X4ZBD6_9BACL|nr:sodium:solute symporter [Paenibacillus sabinae]AHV96936.1 putative Na+/metabolite permease [Paenibacillus sabinae T27]
MTAFVVTCLIVLAVIFVGFLAGRDKAARSSIEQWSVGGRNFGGLLVWFLIGADLYTAYAFLGMTGYAYSFGAPAFFSIAYPVMAFPIAYFIIPKIWRYASKHNLTTLADYARERFQSKLVGVSVAIVSIVFLIPYICLQLSGITGVVQVAGQGVFENPKAVGTVALVVSFILVALYTCFSGLRAPAWTGVIKDLLVWIVLITMIVTIPFIWFDGWGDMFNQIVTKYPEKLTLPGTSPNGALNGFWFATASFISALALFMWPHGATGVLSSKSEEAVRKNTVFLSFYNVLLFFVILLGLVAFIVLPKHPEDPSFANFALLHLIDASYSNPLIQGVMFSTIMLASLVPASIMVLAASNLVATNIVKDIFFPNISGKSQTLVARLFVFVITGLALLFGILFPNYLIQLQLEGVSGIAQILPAIFLSLYWTKLAKTSVFIGLVAGITMVFLNHFIFHLPGYDGFWGLLVNVVVVFAVNFLFIHEAEKNISTNKLLLGNKN